VRAIGLPVEVVFDLSPAEPPCYGYTANWHKWARAKGIRVEEFTPAEAASIRTQFIGGSSITRIAEQIGRSAKAVRRCLVQAGLIKAS